MTVALRVALRRAIAFVGNVRLGEEFDGLSSMFLLNHVEHGLSKQAGDLVLQSLALFQWRIEIATMQQLPLLMPDEVDDGLDVQVFLEHVLCMEDRLLPGNLLDGAVEIIPLRPEHNLAIHCKGISEPGVPGRLDAGHVVCVCCSVWRFGLHIYYWVHRRCDDC